MTTDRHKHVAILLREHAPLASPELRARIEAEYERAERRPAPSVRRIVAACAATALIALALVLPLLTDADSPTVFDVHALSAAGPTSSAPESEPGRPQLLAAQLDGVAFPDWASEFGWEAYGQRGDEFDDRETQTVFYEHEGHTIAYTILSGRPLAVPDGTERLPMDGVEVALLRDPHGHDIAVFEREDKTCVLSGHVLDRLTLVKLASWAGDGAVAF